MSVRHVLQVGNPEEKKILKTRCRPIKLPDMRLRHVIADMFETMYDGEGVGLAAPQIGLTIRLLVIGLPDILEKQEDGSEKLLSGAEEHVLINPRIVKASREEVTHTEGCLSLPNWYGDVPRSEWVTVEYQELSGKQRRMRKVSSFLGWVIQHEVDHLDGILFTERIRDLSTLRDMSEEREATIEKTSALVARRRKVAA